MSYRKSFSRVVTSFLIRYRWKLLPVLLVLAVALGVIEHSLILVGGEQLHLIFDILVYAILLPTGSWLLFTLLKDSDHQRDMAERGLTLRQNLSRTLSDARNWNNLLRKVVEFPHDLIQECAVSLFLFDQEKNIYTLRAACTPDGQVILNPSKLTHSELPKSLSSAQICANPVILKALADDRAVQLPGLIIPLNHSEKRLGALCLDFQPGVSLTPQILTMLHSIGDEIAMAIEGMSLQTVALSQAAATEDERRKIARDLHDTLAQNIGYLRLKLDHLTGEQTVLEISNILKELSLMRDIANEAYQQVRNTLDQLTYSSDKDLVDALANHARMVGGRANFEVTVDQVGIPRYIPLFVRRQMLLIAREGLSNIEKYAQAVRVTIQIVWREQDLALKIVDDGQGYDSQKTTPSGHYGLLIMQERAHEIGGYLTVSSLPGKGTEVTLRIPLGVPAHAES